LNVTYAFFHFLKYVEKDKLQQLPSHQRSFSNEHQSFSDQFLIMAKIRHKTGVLFTAWRFHCCEVLVGESSLWQTKAVRVVASWK